MRAVVVIPRRGEFERARALEFLLEGLVNLNVAIMARYELPPLYESGVRYKKDPLVWRHALNVLRRGKADCKSLAAYRAAELISRGVPAAVIVHRTGRNRLHARVCIGSRLEDPRKLCRRIDDPSLRLGMKRRAT